MNGGGWSIAKKLRTDIDRAGHVCHSKPRSIGRDGIHDDGMFARFRQKRGNKKNAGTREKQERRDAFCRTAKENSEKKTTRKHCEGSRRPGQRADENEKGVGPAKQRWSSELQTRAYAAVSGLPLRVGGCDENTSQTINPLCHLNRSRCVSRGRGRVVNRYWNDYRFIATPSSASQKGFRRLAGDTKGCVDDNWNSNSDGNGMFMQ